MHELEDGSMKNIAHSSRTLLPADNYYSVIERDRLGIVLPIKKNNKFMHGGMFRLQSVHRQLIAIDRSKKGLTTHTDNSL